jgi:glucose-6-phosphate 1-dehydrogenase
MMDESLYEHPVASTLPVPAPASIVIFGASGDLAQRKLIPALYTLFHENRLPGEFAVIGMARTDFSGGSGGDPDAGFRDHLADGARDQARVGGKDAEAWARFATHLHYVRGNYDDPAAYAALERELQEQDQACGTCGNHLFYLATPPHLYPEIVEQLGAAGLDQPEKGYSRIIIEKPFGRDLPSAQALNHQLHGVFHESQIYRIDHYLGKETVQNILAFRFGNAIWEPIWNRNYVDYVQITVSEADGVEERAGYYDHAGVLRDVFQNHLLQLMTLTAMEPPAAFNADFLRDEKVKVLQAARPLAPADIRTHSVRGQYRTYRDEPGVRAGSSTATYGALQLFLDNWRWQGVPFYLRSGKLLPAKVTEITLQFKAVPHSLFPQTGPGGPHANFLGFCIQPDEGMHLRFEAKVPGAGMRLRPVRMDFNFGEEFGSSALPDAYERLLLDAMMGDASLFARSDEIELSWQIIDPIQAAWDRGAEPLEGNWQLQAAPPLEFYERGTWGPTAADRLLAASGRHWRMTCYDAAAPRKVGGQEGAP